MPVTLSPTIRRIGPALLFFVLVAVLIVACAPGATSSGSGAVPSPTPIDAARRARNGFHRSQVTSTTSTPMAVSATSRRYPGVVSTRVRSADGAAAR